MLLAFKLSMPGRNSWNGGWSGEGRPFIIVRSFRDKGADRLPGRYHYDFGDGWRAAVEVGRVDAAEARKLRRQSAGFAGYDWMVDSIVRHGRIVAPSAEAPHA